MAERARFTKAKEIFLQTVEQDKPLREGFINRACAGDDALRQEVLQLLKGDAEADADWEATVRLQVAAQLNQGPPADVVDDYPVGELFGGRYRIQSKLGEGGIGAVYLAADMRLYERPVVVKLLLGQSSHTQYLVDKFKHEGESLARIHHPGVVAVIDRGELPDGKPYLVMEFVKGKTVAAEMQAGQMEYERAARFIHQIAQALSAAHAEGVVHRDLKPANVMIRRLSGGAEQICLIDFGVAKIAAPVSADATQVPMAVGTPAYLAPESLEGREVTPATDIYALGIIAYEMLTGQRPFAVDTRLLSWVTDLLNQQRAGVRVRPKTLRQDLPDAAQAEILKALSYDPEQRHQRAYEFGEALARALTQGKSDAPPLITPPLASQTLNYGFNAAPDAQAASQTLQQFERLWSVATFTDRIRPVTMDFVTQERTLNVRGLGARPKPTKYVYPLGSKLCLAFGIGRSGYLTLLDEGPEGVIYCLCPSWFAPETRLETNDFYLPQAGSSHEAFELSGEPGRERMVAIISDEPLELDWLSNDREAAPARVLMSEDFDALLARLRQLGDGRWTALATYFEVVA